MPTHGYHYCGGLLTDADVSCDVGTQAGTRRVLILPGFACDRCGDTQLAAAQVDILERVLDGERLEDWNHAYVTSLEGSTTYCLWTSVSNEAQIGPVLIPSS